MKRNGKIARLPRPIREQLNKRLQQEEDGSGILQWLNELPEVRPVLNEYFSGRPVSKQNLSEWRLGGYRAWSLQQEMLTQASELTADAGELVGASENRLTDHLATVLAARYTRLLSGWDGELSEEFRRSLRTLRQLSQDIVELRRGDHSAARLKIEQERLQQTEDWSEEELLEHFQRWAKNPKVREWICDKRLSLEERGERLRQIFGVAGTKEKTAESSSVKPGQTESNPVKPV